MNHSTKPVALITGATRGIGRAIALEAAAKGYDIAFCYRSSQAHADSLRQELEAKGAAVVAQALDISNEADVEQFFGAIDEVYGRIDLLVNNAGQTKDGLLATMPLSDMRQVLNTNVIGPLLFSRAALKLMLPARSGNIVNISSISATKPNKGQTQYAASKGAVEAFTRALAVEVASKGIRVNCVAPGVIKTDMAGALLEQYEQAIKKRMLAKQLGTPEDIARMVMFIADPANHYISGEILHVNGGLVLG
ncbi:MAG: 3-oxoacyl-ACP reductase [Kangiellaceae bacterium]|nr:3-oxoacyl-ACP reductase [Kangiellaceae bacterium]|tara:strand:+ start:8327 stop:9076 length:750 start_codon:yes stop_codon:yes gene_type:complete